MVRLVKRSKNILKAYDEIAPHYRQYSEKYHQYLCAIEKLISQNLISGKRLLDVGSGDGYRIQKICTAVGINNVTCIEPSVEMAKICRKNTGFEVIQVRADQLDDVDIQTADYATAMWNVFGHIPDNQTRIASLQMISNKLKNGGKIIIDVNNRHNHKSYGRLEVFKRRVVDFFNFREERGDAYYDWQIGDKTFPAFGHLFTPQEIEGVFKKADLNVLQRKTVNYQTGEISENMRDGQLFYVLEKP